MRKRSVLRLLALLLAVAAIAGAAMFLENRREMPPSRPMIALRGSAGDLTIAVTGDSVIVRSLPDQGADRGFDQIIGTLSSSSLAITNLEETLDDSHEARGAPSTHWAVGSNGVGETLRRIGFGVVTEANNHAADLGGDGLARTHETLDRAGLLHVGAGDDLGKASAPVFVGAPPRRIAIIAVVTSVAAESRATRTRGDIRGRSGVNALRYTAEITADPATLAVLQKVTTATRRQTGANVELDISGSVIRQGPQTSVTFVANQQDLKEILDEISAARLAADVVVVSIHSHEPDNRSRAPAEFVERFARSAIDHGATLVFGHGPRQLRGIEVYKRGAILYSLGSFAFDYASLDPAAADVYDADTNLYQAALEAIGDSGRPVLPAYDESLWWESVIALGTFQAGSLNSVRLYPIDLGVDLPKRDRGTPRAAAAGRSDEILGRLVEMSQPFGTRIRIDHNVGIVDTASP